MAARIATKIAACAAAALAVGAIATGCSSSSSAPTDSSGIEATTGASLPSDFPAGVPVPAGMTLVNGTVIPGGFSATYTGTVPAHEVTTDIDNQFRASGWTLGHEFSNDANGSLATWEKGTTKCQATVINHDGKTGVSLGGATGTAPAAS